MSGDLFALAAADPVTEAIEEAVGISRQALAAQFGFCAQAESPDEFDDRLSLVTARVEGVVGSATRDNPGLFPIVHQEVLESWRGDFEGVMAVRAAEAQQIAAQAAADELTVWPDVKRKKVDKDGNVITDPDDDLVAWPEPKREKHASFGEDDAYQRAVRVGLMGGQNTPPRGGALLGNWAYYVSVPSPGNPKYVMNSDISTEDREEANRWAEALLARWPNGYDHDKKDGYKITTTEDEIRSVIAGVRSTGAMRKGAPFAGYDDFDACLAANQDADDPSAYCGYIKHKVEDGKKEGVAKTALTWQPTNEQPELIQTVEDMNGWYATVSQQADAVTGDYDLPVTQWNWTLSNLDGAEGESGTEVTQASAQQAAERALQTKGFGKTADWRVVNEQTGHVGQEGYATKPEAEGQAYGDGYSVQFVNPQEAKDQPNDVIPDPIKTSALDPIRRISMTAAEVDEEVAKAPIEYQERLAKLKPYLVYGPGYNRNVAESFHDAIRFLGTKNTHAEIYLAKAESHAHYQETGVWIDPWSGQGELMRRSNRLRWSEASYKAGAVIEQPCKVWTARVAGEPITVVAVDGRFEWATAKREGESFTLAQAQIDAVASLVSTGGAPPWAKDDDSKPDDEKSDKSDGGDADAEQPASSDGATDGATGDPTQDPTTAEDQPPADPADPNSPEVPEQTAPSIDPTTMDAGQNSMVNYTMADGRTGQVEVTFVRADEEKGLYYFNGPTGEFAVGNQNDSWTDSDNNTFAFSGTDTSDDTGSDQTTNSSEKPVDSEPTGKGDNPFPPKGKLDDAPKDDDKKEASVRRQAADEYLRNAKSVTLKDGTVIADVMGSDPPRPPERPEITYIGFTVDGTRVTWTADQVAKVNDVEYTLKTDWVSEQMEKQYR